MKVLLIGSEGYIGSYFFYKFNKKYEIDRIDLNWFSSNKKIEPKDFRFLEKKYIEKFESIILLAGHSSVGMCQGNILFSFNNNVKNFIELISKIDKKQKFIYASSSSVYVDTNKKIVDENSSLNEAKNNYDLTKQIIDSYIAKTDLEFYGLRFGTVNGWSPNLRTDIMINSMVDCFFQKRHIKVANKQIFRPILGIEDLANAMCSIIDSKVDNRGIYNLCSFNSSVGEIASQVSEHLGCPMIDLPSNDSYDFLISNDKFRNKFKFDFKENVFSIVDKIKKNYKTCAKSNRNIIVEYY